MGARNDDIRVRIAGDLADINRSLSDLRRNTQRAGRDARNSRRDWNQLNQGLTRVRNQVIGIAAAYVSFRGVTSLIRSVINNTVEQERVLAQVEARIRSTGREAEISTQQLSGMADEFQQLTTFGDAAILSAQAALLAFQNLGTDQLRGATQAALDLAEATGRDLTNAATTVGRALNFPVEGLQALQSAGIRFSGEQRRVIQNLVETGRVAEAQGLILEQIERQYGGAATAARDTFGGALQALQNTIGDLMRADSGVPAARDAVEGLIAVLSDPRTQQAIQEVFGTILRAIGGVTTFATSVAFLFGAARDEVVELDKEIERSRASIERMRADLFSPLQLGERSRLEAALQAEEERLERLTEQWWELVDARGRAMLGLDDDAGPSDPSPVEPASIDARPGIQRLQSQLAAARTIVSDELQRLRRELDQSFEANLVTFEEYYRRRAELEVEGNRRELEERRAALRLLDEEIRLARQRGEDVEERENRRRGLVAEITVLERRRGDVAAQAARDQARAEQELASQLDQVRQRLLELQGETVAARRAQLEGEFGELLQRLQVEGDAEGRALVERLINVEMARTRLQELESEYQRTLTALQRAEQRVQIQVQTGVISEAQGRREVIELNRQYGEQLEALIPAMRELAEATGDPAAIERLRDMEVELQRLQTTGENVARGLRQAFDDAGETFLERFATNASSVGDHLRALFSDIQRQLVRLAANQVWQQLFAGASGQASGFLANLFHSGGVVGGGGSSRRVPAIAFAGAPRLHTGGIPGLRAGEIPAILERGEEVLTRRDPRHRFNGGAGNVTVNVAAETVRGVQMSQMQMSAAVGDAIRAAMERNR